VWNVNVRCLSVEVVLISWSDVFARLVMRTITS
jgi:hypothetical protein